MGTTGRTRIAYIGATILDGTKDMEPLEGMVLVTSGSLIEAVVPESKKSAYAGCEVHDLRGRYLMPGLINMHVHLAGNGKSQKKQRDSAALVRKIMSN
ncbi:MAG: amidohydrolase family protein, partial [Parafannyhessea sp.]